MRKQGNATLNSSNNKNKRKTETDTERLSGISDCNTKKKRTLNQPI